jgi:hypothetical protein
MAIYKGCARDHHGHQSKCYASPELVFPENTVAEIPLRNSVKVLAAMPAGQQPSTDIKCRRAMNRAFRPTFARLYEKSAQPKLICRLRTSRLLQTAAEGAPL